MAHITWRKTKLENLNFQYSEFSKYIIIKTVWADIKIFYETAIIRTVCKYSGILKKVIQRNRGLRSRPTHILTQVRAMGNGSLSLNAAELFDVLLRKGDYWPLSYCIYKSQLQVDCRPNFKIIEKILYENLFIILR